MIFIQKVYTEIPGIYLPMRGFPDIIFLFKKKFFLIVVIYI